MVVDIYMKIVFTSINLSSDLARTLLTKNTCKKMKIIVAINPHSDKVISVKGNVPATTTTTK